MIVTGSRDWPDQWAVWTALADVYSGLCAGDTLTVVHGAHWTGADRHAHIWATRMAPGGPVRVVEERHRALWGHYGRRAGPRRNHEMVSSGAELVLAFPFGESIGTRHCMAVARAAGIEVLEFAA